MNEKDLTDLILAVIFWPGLIFGTHYFYVRKRCHPEWTPWKATARFLWGLAWPFLLALTIATALSFAIEDSEATGTIGRALAPLIVIAVMIPAFARARCAIESPPSR